MKKKTATKPKKTKPKKKVGKDAPFPFKDGPFPMWTRLAADKSFGKDAPFPLKTAGLYYERVSFQNVYQGNNGPNTAKTGVIRSAADLAAQLPGVSLPSINFGSEEVIYVGLGARPDNSHMVEITQVLYLTDRGPKFSGPLTMVDYSEYATPGRSDVETYPLHVIKLKKLDGTETQFSRS
jgi:hypothetical protein